MRVSIDARLQERAPRNVFEHRERAFGSKTDALRLHVAAACGGCERRRDAVDRAHVAERRAIGLERREAAPATDAFVRDPINEERYVTGFFEQDDFEDVRQFRHEELDLTREAEDAETEERIDTFFLAQIEKSPFRRRLRIDPEIVHVHAVVREHDVE